MEGFIWKDVGLYLSNDAFGAKCVLKLRTINNCVIRRGEAIIKTWGGRRSQVRTGLYQQDSNTNSKHSKVVVVKAATKAFIVARPLFPSPLHTAIIPNKTQ